jgi:23S rRNA (cytidine1920-2'-O)/16S rRNA (cytidine1409-2'-O)-methyltransferase
MDKRIRIDAELVRRGLCESRSGAQDLIEKRFVQVNGVIVDKGSRSVREIDEIVLLGVKKYVSRGGEKLEGIFQDVFGSEENITNWIRDKNALDVGSSTGGFTDYLLQHEIAHVDAVDVGTNQLHSSLRGNKKIALFEEQDIRTWKPLREYQIIVADLSFISLQDVMKILIELGIKGMTNYFLLIKPQFEVGKGNTKKGIVKDDKLIKKTLLDVKNLAQEAGLSDTAVFPSHIKGGDGNQEFFLFGKL